MGYPETEVIERRGHAFPHLSEICTPHGVAVTADSRLAVAMICEVLARRETAHPRPA